MISQTFRLDALRTASAERFDNRRLLAAGATALAASLAADGIVRGVSGLLFTVPSSFQPLGPMNWISLTIITLALATLVCTALNRFAERPIWTFRRLVPVLLLVSYIAPILVLISKPWAGTDGSTVGALLVMHTAVALCCFVLLPAVGHDRHVAASG